MDGSEQMGANPSRTRMPNFQNSDRFCLNCSFCSISFFPCCLAAWVRFTCYTVASTPAIGSLKGHPIALLWFCLN